MDFELTDEQRLVSETARRFAEREILPHARDNDRAHRFDAEIVAKMAAQGYLGAIVPEEYGGAGLDHLTYSLIAEEIGRADSSARTLVSVQTSLCCSPILRWASEEQKRRWLPELCSGRQLACFALTEPDAGSDPSSMRTRARRTDAGWVISGQKMWISNGGIADLALVFAQTDPERGHRGIACFLVSTDAPGWSAQPIEGKLGLRASDTAALAFDDLEVGEDALMGAVGDGFKIAMSALDSGRYSVAAGCVGICQGCLDESVRYATEREQYGRPIASFQLVQAMIADMAVQTDAARMLVWRAGALKDSGQAATT
jgi:alkylation response protein AidB-like acyl-CoA dehydrogenase